jgi:CHAD domain-containing protein
MTDLQLQKNQIPLLEELAKNAESETERRRARILLLYNNGNSTSGIAEQVGISTRSVRFWRREFLTRGMEIFSISEEDVEPPGEVAQTISEEAPPPERIPVPKEKVPARAREKPKVRYPRVRKKPGIKPGDAMSEAGRKVLRFHFAHMLNHEEGTRLGEDIEELHDMRVATRRMRAAFEVFGPFYKPKVVKFHLKGLRATGRALGSVRDLDVFMDKAQHYLESVPVGERPGLEPLMHAWGGELADEREKMLAFLDGERYQQFKQDFNEFVSKPGAGARPISETNPKPNLVRDVVPVLIYTHLAAVRTYDTVIANAAIEQLHALRIEFKKLRYAVEFFSEVLGEQARQVIEEIKTLQDHLGDLNDADVACGILREFVDTWEERQIVLPLHERQNPEPVVAYLAAKHAELHNLMVTFPGAWAHFNRPELLENLALAISVL